MKIKSVRISALIIFLAIIMTVYATALYELQIIKGKDYYYESLNSIVTSTNVEASRGGILDRYGNVLVSNRTSYNVTINHSILTNTENPNKILLHLTKVCGGHDVTYTDTLPISVSKPYTYTENMTDTQKSNLEEYIEYFEFEKSPTADELMIFFKEHYGILDTYTENEARIISGLRYELELRLISSVAEYILAKDVDIDFISAVLEQNLTGVQIKTTAVREYHTSYAAHIIGSVGQMDKEEYEIFSKQGYSIDAVIGKSGLEAAFEPYLKGTDGTETSTVTSAGAVTNVIYSKPPVPGGNVVLTLDIGLQEAAEKALAEQISALNSSRGPKEEKIPGGAVVAIQVETGEVLASVSYPTYDLEQFNDYYDKLLADPSIPLLNRALQGTYEPGSTFKIITAIAAMQNGVITPSTRIYDEGRFTEYPSYQPTCWIYPGTHGLINVSEAIRDSCNFFFYTIGNRLGIDKLSQFAGQFGLGRSTGVELYEELGTLATRGYKEEVEKEDWFGGDTLQAAIGQSYNLFTPMQIAAYTATIANSGMGYKSHFLKSVKSYDFSSTIYSSDRETLNSVNGKEEYFKAAQLGMLYVTTQGTPSEVFKDFDVPVAAKTGTAQLGEDLANNAIFICYAPYEDPQIALAVVVEKGGSGNAIAKIAKQVLEYYFSAQSNTKTIVGENRLVD